jgi:hypothetical protein
MPDERSRVEVLQALSDKFGPEAAAALMECVPPFAWTEIATKSDLLALEERMTLRIEARFDRAEARILRWTVGSVFGGIAAVGAATAGVAVLVG